MREVLEAVDEQDFLECSYGFRPKRSAHDALRAVHRMVSRERIAVILEADIQAFFDSVDRKKLLEMLQIRIADPPLLRLLGKCLHVCAAAGRRGPSSRSSTRRSSRKARQATASAGPLAGRDATIRLSPAQLH